MHTGPASYVRSKVKPDPHYRAFIRPFLVTAVNNSPLADTGHTWSIEWRALDSRGAGRERPRYVSAYHLGLYVGDIVYTRHIASNVMEIIPSQSIQMRCRQYLGVCDVFN